MSIKVENKLQKINKEAFEQRAHYVPCKVDEDGPANVETYFEPYVADENGELTASFRGHPLDGAKTSFPEGYRAVIVTETKRPLSEDADRKFHVVGGFKDFINWNWDKKPSKNDNIVKAMDWIDIAEAARCISPTSKLTSDASGEYLVYELKRFEGGLDGEPTIKTGVTDGTRYTETNLYIRCLLVCGEELKIKPNGKFIGMYV